MDVFFHSLKSFIQGQIIYIRLFSIGLLGKDNDGDNTGRHYTIPTYKLLTDTIRKEDLHASSIRKEILRIPFMTMDFSLSFSDFVTELEAYLNELLPTLNRKSCWNYQTYIGHKYKIDFDYLEEKCVVITVGLVWKWERNMAMKKEIIAWVEQKKRPRVELGLPHFPEK